MPIKTRPAQQLRGTAPGPCPAGARAASDVVKAAATRPDDHAGVQMRTLRSAKEKPRPAHSMLVRWKHDERDSPGGMLAGSSFSAGAAPTGRSCLQ